MELPMTIKKIINVSDELNNGIANELSRDPRKYRNHQNQLSEAELIRQAIAFYLQSLSDSSIERNPAA
jgi:hypothetical protein